MGTLRRDPPAPRGARGPPDAGRVRAIDSPDESVARSAGETLADIAKQWNVTTAGLMMENNLVSEKVKPGKTLRLPPAGR